MLQDTLDACGGGMETINRDDKQGLGLTARNKKRFVAQQMLVLLAGVAHNVIVWGRAWMAPACPKVSRYGMMRMVGDVFTTRGALELDAGGDLKRVTLNALDPLANGLIAALKVLVRQKCADANSGET